MFPDDQFYVKLEGDPSIAGAYLGYAKNIAKQVYAQAIASNGYSSKVLATNDALIKINVTPTTRNIVIQAEGEQPIEIISGMTDASKQIYGPDSRGNSVLKCHRFYPSSMEATIEKVAREWRDEAKLAASASLNNTVVSSDYFSFCQTANVMPAKYTGKMCQVAQLAMGIKMNQIQYQWKFGCTHGIYTDSKGALWLIEISVNNGILAKKLSGYKHANNKTTDAAIKAYLPIVPDGKAFPVNIGKAIENGSVRRLATYDQLSEFYSKSAFYDDCGWSFNTNGSLAINTCWDWPDDYKRGYLYQINIVSGDNGPTSASITKQESGFLWNPDHSSDLPSSRLNFPSGHNCEVVTFECRNAGYPKPAPARDRSAPVHAFFVGDAPYVYKMQSFPGTGPAAPEGWTPVDPATLPRDVYFGSFMPSSDASYNVNFKYTSGTAPADMIDFSGPNIPAPDFEYSHIEQTIKFTKYNTGPGTGTGEVIVNQPGYRSEYFPSGIVFRSVYSVRSDETFKQNVSKIQANALTISPNNRSCVFVSSYKFTTTGATYERSTYLGSIIPPESTIEVWGLLGATNESNAAGIKYFYEIIYSGPNGSYFTNVPPVGDGFDPSYVSINSDRTFACHFIFNSLGPDHLVTKDYPYDPTITHYNYTSSAYGESKYVMNMRCKNGINDIATSIAESESSHFFMAYQPSPDAYGNTINFSSGRSSFLSSHFESRLANDINGPQMLLHPTDGEDMSTIGIFTSWVGFE